MEIRHIYDGKQDLVSDALGLDCKDKSRTKQSEKDACDINKITARYEPTGQLPDLIRTNPRYGDFSEVPTYQEALHIVMHAQDQFAALDAKIRNRFQNDPAQFLAFATDQRNLKEMVELGLATAPVEPPAPVAVPPVVAPGVVQQ